MLFIRHIGEIHRAQSGCSSAVCAYKVVLARDGRAAHGGRVGQVEAVVLLPLHLRLALQPRVALGAIVGAALLVVVFDDLLELLPLALLVVDRWQVVARRPASWLAVCKTLATDGGPRGVTSLSLSQISRMPLEVVDIIIYTRKGSWARVDGCSEPLTASDTPSSPRPTRTGA